MESKLLLIKGASAEKLILQPKHYHCILIVDGQYFPELLKTTYRKLLASLLKPETGMEFLDFMEKLMTSAIENHVDKTEDSPGPPAKQKMFRTEVKLIKAFVYKTKAEALTELDKLYALSCNLHITNLPPDEGIKSTITHIATAFKPLYTEVDGFIIIAPFSAKAPLFEGEVFPKKVIRLLQNPPNPLPIDTYDISVIFATHKPKPVMQIGHLRIFTDKVLGQGLAGVTVYKGMFDQRKVAVKVLPKDLNEVADSEIQALLVADSNPHVVRYYIKEEDSNFIYLAIERCPGSLVKLVEFFNATPAQRTSDPKLDELGKIYQESEIIEGTLLQVAHETLRGLQYLHSIGITHNNLKPSNIFVSFHKKAKLSDIGLHRIIDSITPTSEGNDLNEWQAPEHAKTPKVRTKEKDYFAIGCCLYYLLSKGKHPFGVNKKAQMKNIQQNKYDISDISNADAQHLVYNLILPNPSERWTAEIALNFIIFWPGEKILTLLNCINEAIITQKLFKKFDTLASNYALLANCEKGRWDKAIHACLVTDLVHGQSSYHFDSPSDLIRMIRNKYAHYAELHPTVTKVLGPLPNSFLEYFKSRFPFLNVVLFEFAKENKLFGL